MSLRARVSAALIGLFSIALPSAASAAPIIWTDWQAFTIGITGAASGVMGAVGVNYSGQVSAPTQTSCGTSYFATTAPYLSATVVERAAAM